MNTFISENQLVSELWARDVRFLMGRQFSAAPLLAPANLIAGLAQSTIQVNHNWLTDFCLKHGFFGMNFVR